MPQNTESCDRCGARCDSDMRRSGTCYHCRQFELMVKRGLKYAMIEPLPSAMFWKPSTPLAVFGGLEVSNSGRGYWRVNGLIPMAVARLIYGDPVGRDVIRAGGHCMGTDPETQATWRKDGREVVPEDQKAEFERFIAKGYIKKEAALGLYFSDDPRSIGAYPFVAGYDIDGELGLRVFADILRANGMGAQ